MGNVDPKVLEKIKKLLDHHAGCLKINSEQEAFSALELAKSIMKKYHLDMMQVKESFSDSDITHKSIDKCSVYKIPIWMCNLINIVNNICNCSCILEKVPQTSGYIHISIVFVCLESELDKVSGFYNFLKKTTYRLANKHVKEINGNYTNWRSFSEGFTSRLLERSRIFNIDISENTWRESVDETVDAEEFSDDDFEESEIEKDDIDEDFEEFDDEDDDVPVENKENSEKDNKVQTTEQKTDIQLYEYLRNVKKKIETYIKNNMNNIRYENVNRKSKVLKSSYMLGREQAENTNLKFVDKSHQLTSQKKEQNYDQ